MKFWEPHNQKRLTKSNLIVVKRLLGGGGLWVLVIQHITFYPKSSRVIFWIFVFFIIRDKPFFESLLFAEYPNVGKLWESKESKHIFIVVPYWASALAAWPVEAGVHSTYRVMLFYRYLLYILHTRSTSNFYISFSFPYKIHSVLFDAKKACCPVVTCWHCCWHRCWCSSCACLCRTCHMTMTVA